jgi:lysophospholipase L1-like esterase
VRIAAVTFAAAAAAGALLSLGALAAPSPPNPPRTVLDLGDSLSVGTDPYLRARLRGYRIERFYDVGLHAYDAATIVSRARASLPAVLVVSAGTNDDPRIVATFIRALSGVVRTVGPRRCVVWPTIARPAAVGASYDGFNRALAQAGARYRNLVLVDWVGLIRRHPGWLSGDGVHVSAEGYRARAAAIATAVRTRCRAVTG